jgi:hypothetical protein
MEQKAPRLSSASLVVGGLCVAFAILNSTADLILQAGLTVEEVASLGLAGLLFCCLLPCFSRTSNPRTVEPTDHSRAIRRP